MLNVSGAHNFTGMRFTSQHILFMLQDKSLVRHTGILGHLNHGILMVLQADLSVYYCADGML